MKLTHPTIQNFIGIWANDLYIMIPNGVAEQTIELGRPRYLWHYMWAYLFYLFDIDSTQMILRAKIIHVVQTLISLGSIYYFSNVILRNVFKEIPIVQLRWLSLWSVIIWLTIFATFSAAYHQVWMMWYSLNYQITLPLFWYMLGLTLVLLLEENSWKIKLFFVFQILVLSRFMIQVHSMEFMYYLMHMLVFALVFIDKVYVFVKRYFYLLIPIVLGLGYFIKNYQPEKSKIFSYMSVDKLPELYEYIMGSGHVLLSGFNRASGSINELMYVIGTMGVVFLAYLLWVYKKEKRILIDVRMGIFISLTSLFVLIPLYQFTSGLFAMITYTMVVNRLYYSSSIFILLPLIVYATLQHKIKHTIYIHLMIGSILLGTFVYSRYDIGHTQNYYKNIQSIKNSFTERKVGFNLSQEQIKTLGMLLKKYEANNVTGKEVYYYARADMAFVLKYIYKRKVYWEGRSRNPDYVNLYKNHKNYNDYYPILFEVPEGFPQYHPYL